MACDGGFTVSVTGADEHEKCESFDDLGLNQELLRGIYSFDYVQPTAFQQYSLRPVLGGRNIIGQGQNGVGKTATSLIGALQKVDYSKNVCQALILAPTREGAQSIHKLVVGLGSHLNVRCVACTGGTSARADLQKLKEGQHIVISTPGRVVDMVGKGQLQIDALRQFILDGADEILSRGLQEEIYKVFKKLPSKVQIQLYSAAMTPELIDITTKFIHGAALIVLEKEEQTMDGVRHFYIAVEEEDWKFDTLCDLYETLTITQAVVFCNSRKTLDQLADQLLERQFTVSTLHADHNPKERELIMKEYSSGGSSILICTDTPTAVEAGKLVINYELPSDPELYLTRCGRSSGKGFAINLVTDNDVQIKEDIENLFEVQMEEMPEDIETVL